MLHEFIHSNRGEILHRAQSRASSRSTLSTTSAEPEPNSGIPLFLDELVQTLRDDKPNKHSAAQIAHHAAHHGNNRFAEGFSVTDVVRDYGDVCQAVTGLAIEKEAPITVVEFRGLNRCLDDAVTVAVAEYVRASQAAPAELAGLKSERSLVLRQQMRHHLDLACVSVEVLKQGSVSIGGRTGNLLDDSLLAMRGLLEAGFSPALAQAGDLT